MSKKEAQKISIISCQKVQSVAQNYFNTASLNQNSVNIRFFCTGILEKNAPYFLFLYHVDHQSTSRRHSCSTHTVSPSLLKWKSKQTLKPMFIYKYIKKYTANCLHQSQRFKISSFLFLCLTYDQLFQIDNVKISQVLSCHLLHWRHNEKFIFFCNFM